MTSHNPRTVNGGKVLYERYFLDNWNLFYDAHNHPSGNPNPSSNNFFDSGDIARKEFLEKNYELRLLSSQFFIYTKGGNYAPY